MNNRLVIVGFSNEYDLMDIVMLSERYSVLHIKIPSVMKSLLLMLKFHSEKMSTLIIEIWLKNKVRFEDGDVVVFDDSFISIDFLYSKIKSKNEGCAKTRNILLLRNIIKSNEKMHSIIRSKSDIEVFSFDPGDCEKFNLRKYEQYCSGFKYLKDNRGVIESKYCLYFIGLDKGRSIYLNRILEHTHSYSSKIHLVFKPKSLYEKVLKFLGSKKFNYLSYKSHLDNVLESDVVIDLVQDGQSGLTMRSLEALISGKKIITNNKLIIDEIFYNENQILIIDDFESLDSREIFDFIESSVEVGFNTTNDFSVISVYKYILES
ncbi:hypothetical protein BCU36_022845 [Vibrio lentus]|uniref:hypothetical protein n=1 Tax=Vibrio lentus TaxID=136468 RepID=UPI000C821EA3|nr:hypothetical protein [Vibrio lentus]PMI85242.1 hypothetical protein BCU36_00975 [Vibrio lentus]